jgi:hypothetical protein
MLSGGGAVRGQQPHMVYTVKDIASEWQLSIDTVQRLFAVEPDVFVIKSGRKRTLRIPAEVKVVFGAG